MIWGNLIIFFNFNDRLLHYFLNNLVVRILFYSSFEYLKSLSQLLQIDQSFSLSIIWFWKSLIKFDSHLAIQDALFKLTKFKMGIRSVGIINMIWLNFNGASIIVNSFLEIPSHECFVSSLFKSFRIVFVNRFFLSHFIST